VYENASAAAIGPPLSREAASEAVRAYYHATHWDFRLLWSASDLHFGLHHRPWRRHAEALRRTNRLLADLAEVGADSRVVDAGCGVGGTSLQLAAERGARVVGLTLVSAQAREAARRAARAGLTARARFVVADYTDSGLDGASFDAVIATESLCHAPDKAAFYREAARLLRPGGRLVVAEYVRTSRRLDDGSERLLGEWMRGWALPGLDTADEHRDHAGRAGFEDVRVEDRGADFAASFRRLHRMTRLAWPLACLGHALGLRSMAAHGNVVGSLRFMEALESGAWFYALVTARRGAETVPHGAGFGQQGA